MKTQTFLLTFDARYRLWRYVEDKTIRFCADTLCKIFDMRIWDGELEMTVGSKKWKGAQRIKIMVGWFHTGLRYVVDGTYYTVGPKAFKDKNPQLAMYNEIGRWLHTHKAIKPPGPKVDRRFSAINLYVSVKRKVKP